MKKYRVRSDKEFKKIWVTKDGLFGESVLKKYTDAEFQSAVEYTKQKAGTQRPSRVTLINSKGQTTMQWDYGKLSAPKKYENSPRRNR